MKQLKNHICGCKSFKNESNMLIFKNVCETHKRKGLHYLALKEQSK